MHVVRFELAYEGKDYHGWQIQPNDRTVQGEVHAALGELLGTEVLVNGASRTDAGVHALGQVVSFPWPGKAREMGRREIQRALNALLPHDMSVLRLETIHQMDHRGRPFHARHCARGKRYRYRFWVAPMTHPFHRNKTWHLKYVKDLKLAIAAAQRLVGRHDFAGFRASDCSASDTVRDIYRVDLNPVDQGAGHVELVVEGSAFLKNMVRIIAGTLADVARGRLRVDDVELALARGDRRKAGQTAPPHGLCLEEVFYPDFPWEQQRWTKPVDSVR